MSFKFIPVQEITDFAPISVGLSGASGTGKTFSALLLARGIAQEMTGEKNPQIGGIDTENLRMLHYRRDFPELVHADFTALDDEGRISGFTIDRWLEMIDLIEAEQIPVGVIDSFSHSWSGVGGLLEMQALVLDRIVAEAEKRAGGRYAIERDKYSQLAWAEVKPQYRRLIDRIIRAKTHFVICTRAKKVMQKGFGEKKKNAFETKTRRDDIPWNPETDGDLMFDLTAMIILDPSVPGCPVHHIKVADQFKGIFDQKRPITEETGRRLAKWAKGEGDAQKQKKAMDRARAMARQGVAAFTAWWQSDEGKKMREAIRPIVSELKDLAQDADRATSADDEIPFEADEATPAAPTPETETQSEAA